MDATLPHLQPYTKSSGLLSYASSCVTHTTYHEPQKHIKTNILHARKRDTNSNRQGNENERASYKTTVDNRKHETRTRKYCSLLRHPRPQDGRRAAKARRDNEGTVNLSSQSHKPGETVPDHPQIFQILELKGRPTYSTLVGTVPG